MAIRDVLQQIRMEKEGISQTISGASLALYAQEKMALLIWSALLEDTLWIASSPRQAQALIQTGVNPEKIWTPRAIIAMAELPEGCCLPEDLTVSDALDLFGGRIIRVMVEDQP